MGRYLAIFTLLFLITSLEAPQALPSSSAGADTAQVWLTPTGLENKRELSAEVVATSRHPTLEISDLEGHLIQRMTPTLSGLEGELRSTKLTPGLTWVLDGKPRVSPSHFMAAPARNGIIFEGPLLGILGGSQHRRRIREYGYGCR